MWLSELQVCRAQVEKLAPLFQPHFGILSSTGLQYPQLMSVSFESVLLSVWQQALVDKKKVLEIDGETYPVRHTAKSKLKQIDFRFEGRELRGLEQNPNTKSRWAKLAREGKQVMQFLEGGRYIAVVVDGKIQTYK
jgi:hypothetical protein